MGLEAHKWSFITLITSLRLQNKLHSEVLAKVRTSTWILWRHSSAYNIQMLKDRIYSVRQVEDIFCSIFLKRFLRQGS